MIDGVLGLDGAPGHGNVFYSLFAAGLVDADIFGMCLAAGGSSNGTFTVGHLDSRLFTGEFAWAPYSGGSSAGSYQLEMASVGLGGKPLNVSGLPRNAIVDSGTNVLLLPRDVFAAVAAGFGGLCDGGTKLVGICGLPNGLYSYGLYSYGL